MNVTSHWTPWHAYEALQYLCAALTVDALPVTIVREDVADEESFRRAVVRWVDIDGEEAAVTMVRARAESRVRIEAPRVGAP